MNQIDKIHYDVLDADIRVIVKQDDQSIWFVASDIAKMLEYRDSANMVRGLDEDECDTHIVSTTSDSVKSRKSQEMTIISESGLYQVILNAKTDRVKPFKHWLTHEVLPQIRKTGCYVPTHRVPNRREMREDLVAVLDVADRLSKTFSKGVQQAYLLEQDQAHFDETSKHLLPKLAIEEATMELSKIQVTYDPSENTFMAARVPVADFASVNVGELAKLYNNKHITTTVINRFLTDGGYQVPISKRKFAKTAISKDIATEKKALTGDTAGRKYITGWRKTNELMSYLNSCVQKYIKQF